MDNIEKVMAGGPIPKKKHLLRRLAKKVLIHSRQTIEIWYALPNTQRFEDCNIWLPTCNSIRSRPGWVEPEVWFRIVHLAQEGHKSTPVAANREQMVEIALGPKGAFENGNIGALRLRAPPSQVVSPTPPDKPAKVPKTPRVVELLRKAIEWNALLESGEVTSQAKIACSEGITRARVTQVMGMLRLDPKIQEQIQSMPDADRRPLITERILRQLVTIADHNDQLRKFQQRLSAS